MSREWKTTNTWVRTVLLLCILALFFSPVVSASGLIHEDEMQIDTPYQYPVLPGSEEWAAFTSRQERLAACYVDESILEAMTTEALIETIITYPMLIDIYAYPTLEEGIAQISENFAGILILMERDDVASVLSSNLQTYSQSTSIQDVYIKSINQIINNNPSVSSLNYTIETSIKTPNGTTVDAITDVPWSYLRTI